MDKATLLKAQAQIDDAARWARGRDGWKKAFAAAQLLYENGAPPYVFGLVGGGRRPSFDRLSQVIRTMLAETGECAINVTVSGSPDAVRRFVKDVSREAQMRGLIVTSEEMQPWPEPDKE